MKLFIVVISIALSGCAGSPLYRSACAHIKADLAVIEECMVTPGCVTNAETLGWRNHLKRVIEEDCQ